MPREEPAWTATGIADAVRGNGRSSRTPEAPAAVGPEAGSVAATVLEIVAAAVRRESVEPGTTFGAIGGDSLGATQILARIWRALDVRLPLSSLAPDTEIGAFVALVEERHGGREAEAAATDASLRRGDGPDVERLTPGQVAILLSAELSGSEGHAAATLPVVLRLRGALDPVALRDSLDALIRRHQALSLQIGDRGRGLFQSHRQVGLAELPSVEAGADQMAPAREHARLKIDPAEPPLLRPLLIRIGPGDHLLVLAIHHAACDGWSVRVLLRELPALYEAAITAAGPPALGEAVGFLDFARWQRRLLAHDQDRLVSFWESALEPLPCDRWLPTDFDRPHFRSGKGDAEHFAVDPSLLAELRAFGGEHGVTTFMSLLTAYAVVLADFAGVSDVIIGAPMANRPHPLLDGTVGYLSNTVPIRVGLGGEPTVRELLGRVRRASLAAYDHQALPLPNLIAALSPRRDVSVPPIFQVCLVFNDMQPTPMHGLEVETVLLHKGSSPYDLTLYLEQRAESLDGYVEYPTDLFQAETIRELRRRLIRVLKGMTDDPDAGALGLVPSRAREVR